MSQRSLGVRAAYRRLLTALATGRVRGRLESLRGEKACLHATRARLRRAVSAWAAARAEAIAASRDEALAALAAVTAQLERAVREVRRHVTDM